MQNNLFEETLRALPSKSHRSLSTFLSALEQACRDSPPPYGEQWYADGYNRFASNPHWLAASFFTYAHEEADGAERLAMLASNISQMLPAALSIVLKHERDEVRHISYFLNLLDSIFPQFCLDETARSRLQQRHQALRVTAHTGPAPISKIVAEVVRINIGEVKNRVHLLLMRQWALNHCNYDNLDRVNNVTASLVRDEVNHIIYTGFILEMINRSHLVGDIANMYTDEFRRFNVQLMCDLKAHNVIDEAK